jgi:hypothetical protein
MLFDNFPLPLPWYPLVTLQDRFRQNVAMNAVITQLAPNDGLLPFQFRKPTSSEYPATWKIKCAENGILQDYIDGYSDSTVLDISSFSLSALEVLTLVDADTLIDYDYFIFKNEKNSLSILAALAGGLPPGVYYMEMDFGTGIPSNPESGGKWCSETFRVPSDVFTWDIPAEECNYPCFKWSNNSEIAPLHYDSGDDNLFYNLLYLDTWITASEPVYEQTGENDGYNEFHANFQKLIIKYRLSCAIPDYIKIALYAMQLHENKYLFTEHQLRQGEIKNLEISATLSTDGALSFVEMLFEQMVLTVKTNCMEEMAAPVGYSIVLDTPVVLTTGFCDASGAVDASVTGGPIPAGIFAELWGQVGVGAYTLVYPYISKADLIAGWSGNIGPGTGIGHFKLVFRTFAFYVTAESTISVPSPTC